MQKEQLKNIKIISAGAGSGKTYRLTEEMVALLKGGVRASGIIATTFTNKAAAELQERVRIKLLEQNLTKEADQLANALIGTVHGLGVKLLKRFAFEAGVSPQVDIIADGDHQLMFNQSLSTVLTQERMEQMEHYSSRLGLNKKGDYDWRKAVKEVTDIARANDFSTEILEKSKVLSFEEFKKYLGKPSKKSGPALLAALKGELRRTIEELEANEDSTKVTQSGADTFKGMLKKLNLKGALEWHEWVKISKTKVGAKSRDAVENLKDLAQKHECDPAFHHDIQQFIYGVFDIAIEAIKEYETYKKRRGLIDYTDMELKVKQLLANPQVQAVLSEELDLLMVDEFQDTSPIQLEIFLKLSQFANHSIWVGDPKQSIYGFRGADPSLMMEIIKQTGGVKKEDIQIYSWRSRAGVVHATNAIFCKAFGDLPEAQVALIPQRTEEKIIKTVKDQEFLEFLHHPLMHWHMHYDGEKRMPGRPWMENCIATSIKKTLESGKLVFPKEEDEPRLIEPGDIAVLCRSNALCGVMAEALHRAGIKAAISRNGLLETAEAKLVLACLKFIVSRNDALSIAEILKLASGTPLKDIVEDRLNFLEMVEKGEASDWQWGTNADYIQQLNDLRIQGAELSSSEIINLVLEELDLRRIIASWGNSAQRMGNIDELRQLALTYEENCNRLHSAATLGGFLLWLNNLGREELDKQSSGAGRDAVNVMTYHKSKGLEWPMVICHDLEVNLRDKIWGVQIVPESDEVDLDNILGNRWLRYWVNPYADQIRNTLLEERINTSEVKKQAQKEALQEEARVLYVGITRARDYLVFPTRKNPSKWLNRVWHEGDEKVPTLDPYTDDSQWVWKEEGILKLDTQIFPYPRDFTTTDLAGEDITFITKRNGKTHHETYPIDVERDHFQAEISAKIAAVFDYRPQLALQEEGNQYFAAKAVKAFMSTDDTSLSAVERFDLAEAILERFGVAEMLDLRNLILHSKTYLDFVDKTFSAKKVYKKYPVRYHFKNRLFEKVIDLVLETDSGLVIIQNSGFAKGKKEWKNKALKLAPWFFLAKMALQEQFSGRAIRCFLHFPLGGGMVELEVEQAQ
ncbi:MAG: UvrD-helicase domain-containing protein, partial [Bacteroidota bacterium]